MFACREIGAPSAYCSVFEIRPETWTLLYSGRNTIDQIGAGFGVMFTFQEIGAPSAYCSVLEIRSETWTLFIRVAIR